MKKLNLGCGYRKEQGCINIDNRAEVSPDIVADINDRLPFPSNSIDEVRAVDFLEHVPIGKTIHAVEEIYRVLKNNGTFYHMTPSTEGRGAFQDPTHVSFWNLNSWLYYTDDAYRDLYGTKAKFKIISLGDVTTNKQLKVIHTKGLMKAVK